MWFPSRRARVAGALLGLSFTGILAARASAQPRRITDGIAIGEPPPSWVEPVEVPAPREAENGIERLLHEHQWRLEAERRVEFERVAYRIASTAGLAQGAEIAIHVHSSERLTWHSVRRIRDGVATEVLAADRVRVIQPESRLGRGLYDERRSALLFVDDVRVGDVLEYAVTRVEDTALLGGRHAARLVVARNAARRVRFVVRWPEARGIEARVHEAPAGYRIERAPGVLRIEALDVPLPEIPPAAPASIAGAPWVEISEFGAWSDVAAWAVPHYRVDAPEVALAEVPMAGIRAAGDLEAQVAAALRYVQDEVRYLGLEVAERALVPHAPDEVARRRYGDCKDKSLLLVTILGALGVRAEAALTHSRRGDALEGELPSPYAFDHVVVRAWLGGEALWFDATRSFERGPLRARPPIGVRRALPIVAGASLVEVPLPIADEPTSSIDEHYVARDGRSTLEVVTTLRGDEAIEMRAELDARGAEQFAESALEFYRERGLGPRPSAPLAVEHDEEAGTLTLREQYVIERFWGPGVRQVGPWSIEGRLPIPDDQARDLPVAIPFPLHLVHRTTVTTLDEWSAEPSDDRVANEAFELSHRVAVRGRVLVFETRLRTLRDRIEPEALDAYRRDAREADSLLGDEVFQGSGSGAEDSHAGALVCLGLFAFAFVVAFAGGALRRRLGMRRSRAFRRKQAFAAGESPQRAIEVADRAEAERAHRAASCCGARIEGGEWSQAQLAGARIFVHSAVCTSCGASHRVYYRQRG